MPCTAVPRAHGTACDGRLAQRGTAPRLGLTPAPTGYRWCFWLPARLCLTREGGAEGRVVLYPRRGLSPCPSESRAAGTGSVRGEQHDGPARRRRAKAAPSASPRGHRGLGRGPRGMRETAQSFPAASRSPLPAARGGARPGLGHLVHHEPLRARGAGRLGAGLEVQARRVIEIEVLGDCQLHTSIEAPPARLQKDHVLVHAGLAAGRV